MGASSYVNFTFGGKPVLAVPAGSRSNRVSALNCYQPYTLRRKLFLAANKSLVWFGIDYWLYETSTDPTGSAAPFTEWLDVFADLLGHERFLPVVVWPPQTDRGRVYIHVLDELGRRLLFSKASLDDKNDELLGREARLLRQLDSLRVPGLSIPSVVAVQSTGRQNHNLVVYEPLPTGSRGLARSFSSFPEGALLQVLGAARRIGRGGLESLSWWPPDRLTCQEPFRALLEDLRQADAQAMQVGRSHGDLTTANVVRDKTGDLWIYDWEESREDAPVLTDSITFYLDAHRRDRYLRRLLDGFWREFLSTDGSARRNDVLLALAFVARVHPALVAPIASNWRLLARRAA